MSTKPAQLVKSVSSIPKLGGSSGNSRSNSSAPSARLASSKPSSIQSSPLKSPDQNKNSGPTSTKSPDQNEIQVSPAIQTSTPPSNLTNLKPESPKHGLPKPQRSSSATFSRISKPPSAQTSTSTSASTNININKQQSSSNSSISSAASSKPAWAYSLKSQPVFSKAVPSVVLELQMKEIELEKEREQREKEREQREKELEAQIKEREKEKELEKELEKEKQANASAVLLNIKKTAATRDIRSQFSKEAKLLKERKLKAQGNNQQIESSIGESPGSQIPKESLNSEFRNENKNDNTTNINGNKINSISNSMLNTQRNRTSIYRGTRSVDRNIDCDISKLYSDNPNASPSNEVKNTENPIFQMLKNTPSNDNLETCKHCLIYRLKLKEISEQLSYMEAVEMECEDLRNDVFNLDKLLNESCNGLRDMHEKYINERLESERLRIELAEWKKKYKSIRRRTSVNGSTPISTVEDHLKQNFCIDNTKNINSSNIGIEDETECTDITSNDSCKNGDGIDQATNSNVDSNENDVINNNSMEMIDKEDAIETTDEQNTLDNSDVMESNVDCCNTVDTNEIDISFEGENSVIAFSEIDELKIRHMDLRRHVQLRNSLSNLADAIDIENDNVFENASPNGSHVAPTKVAEDVSMFCNTPNCAGDVHASNMQEMKDSMRELQQKNEILQRELDRQIAINRDLLEKFQMKQESIETHEVIDGQIEAVRQTPRVDNASKADVTPL